jgi:hypothetical protein
MHKDILFFSYSWVDNANYIFKKFESLGYKCDFVYENTIQDFKPVNDYKVIFLYLHEDYTIPITNKIIDTFYKYSYLVQHDDTDFENIQVWSNKKPDLIMHRELTDSSKNPWDSPVFPFHFPIFSKYDKEYQKYPEPESQIDPLYIYYTSLFKEKPESKLAILWLTEHGIFEGDERDELVDEYKKIKSK